MWYDYASARVSGRGVTPEEGVDESRQSGRADLRILVARPYDPLVDLDQASEVDGRGRDDNIGPAGIDRGRQRLELRRAIADRRKNLANVRIGKKHRLDFRYGGLSRIATT